MTAEEAIALLDGMLEKNRLSDLQVIVFSQSWEGKSYSEIARSIGYGTDHIKHVGSNLWLLLSETLGEKVTKNNFRSALRRYKRQLDQREEGAPATALNPQEELHS
jgi:DNA-directed RNA polymerase specialized sigma24 family protein